MSPPRVVALVSGGIDSTVLMARLLALGADVLALSVDYGQRHRRELLAAAAVSEAMCVPHHVLIAPSLVPPQMAPGGPPAPRGHYQDESMRATVTPHRNLLLIALAASWGAQRGATAVAYAAHAGDHAIYPDCRPEFALVLGRLLRLSHYEPLELLAPFLSATKGDIVRAGHELGAPLHLTWSCYEGGSRHCARCGTCVERIEAFRLAGVPDPTDYA